MTFSLKSKSTLLFTATFAVLCMVAASLATAGPLATTNFALNDGFGPDAGRWRGTATIVVPPVIFGHTVVAEVDWAAFARSGPGDGKFQKYLDSQAIAQVDPSAPLEVLYAYQVVSVTAAVPGIHNLTVGLDLLDGRIANSHSFVPTGAGSEVAPNNADGDNGTSMGWIFDNDLDVGNTSPILIFRSPFAPELDFLQVTSGLAGPNPSPLVASPSDRIFEFDIPEPSSVALGLMGFMGLFGTRRKSAR